MDPVRYTSSPPPEKIGLPFKMGPPAVMGATEIFELDKLLTAVEAHALSEAATPVS